MRRYKRILAMLLVVMLTISITAPVEAATSKKDLLNGLTLNPIKTGYQPLDQMVEKTLKKVVKNDMTTYDKVLACYNYLIETLSYSSSTWDAKSYYDIYIGSKYTSSMDKKVLYDAYRAFKFKKAACNGYSAAFVVLTRAIGLPTYMVQGQTAKAGGGYLGHYWVNLKANGTYYVFDPQVEDNIAKGCTVYYYRFFKQDLEIPGKYLYKNREADIKEFNFFTNIKSISISNSKLVLYPGDKVTLKTTLNPTNANVTVTYQSSDKTIATVSKAGKITAKKTGKVTITVQAGKLKKKCTVTIKKRPVQK